MLWFPSSAKAPAFAQASYGGQVGGQSEPNFKPGVGFEPTTYGLRNHCPACQSQSPRSESNRQPMLYESIALPIELHGLWLWWAGLPTKLSWQIIIENCALPSACPVVKYGAFIPLGSYAGISYVERDMRSFFNLGPHQFLSG